jgi:cellulose synthase/poly-beta-1,6-N-acetylglucosamine synthase-like glycosyltransferase
MLATPSLTVWAEAVFWLCTALVVYVYAAYPALLWVLARLFGVTATRPKRLPLPFVSVVIAAHNEERVIQQRLDNLLALDYPADRLEILIASDGSTDHTCEIVRQCPSPRVRLLDFTVNRGKTAVLNDAVQQAKGEIILLSDANTMLDRRAARRMAYWFGDPRVGVVCGRLVLVDSSTGENADGVYWKYETFLKIREARLGALLGANGALYAIRRSLFPNPPDRIAVDDFVIPLLAQMRSGCRIVYEADAVAYEETPAEIRSEFARRSRIGAGGFQSLSLLWPLLNPLRGWIALAFASHKVLRWVCPFFLLGAAIASTALIVRPLYLMAVVGQLALYGVALAVYLWPGLGSTSRIARLPTLFTAMNLALLAGFVRWISGRQAGVWERTARSDA